MSQLYLNDIQLGKNADPTKNFKIVVPTPEDGTLTIERGDGTDVLVINADGTISIPGNLQSWQNVAASRAISTLYTNTTKQTIDVALSLINNTAGILLWAEIDGVQTINSISQPAVNNRIALYFSVPPGATYKVATSSGTNSSITWWELR